MQITFPPDRPGDPPTPWAIADGREIVLGPEATRADLAQAACAMLGVNYQTWLIDYCYRFAESIADQFFIGSSKQQLALILQNLRMYDAGQTYALAIAGQLMPINPATQQRLAISDPLGLLSDLEAIQTWGNNLQARAIAIAAANQFPDAASFADIATPPVTFAQLFFE